MYNKEETELNKLQEFNNVVIVDSDVINTDNIAVEEEKSNDNKSYTNNYSKLKKINNDMKTAMKNQDKETLSVIRMLKSAVQLAAIEKKHDLTDE